MKDTLSRDNTLKYRCSLDYSAFIGIGFVSLVYDYLRSKGRKINRYIIDAYVEFHDCIFEIEDIKRTKFEVTKIQYIFYKYKFKSTQELVDYVLNERENVEKPKRNRFEKMCISFKPKNDIEANAVNDIINLRNKDRVGIIYNTVYMKLINCEDEEFFDFAAERYLDNLCQAYSRSHDSKMFDELKALVHIPFISKYSALYEVDAGLKLVDIE